MDQKQEKNQKVQEPKTEPQKNDGENTIIDPRLPAGFMRRAAAWIIDNSILSIIYILINLILIICFGRGLAGIMIFILEIVISFFNVNIFIFTTIITLFAIICSWLLFMWLIGIYYHAWFENSKYKGSPGKLALGIYVVSLNGTPVTLKQALLRNISKFLSGIFFGLGYLMAAVGLRNEALHDLISQTLVVRKEKYENEKLLAGYFAAASLGIFMYLGLFRQDTSLVVLKVLLPSFENSIFSKPKYKPKFGNSEIANDIAKNVIRNAVEIANNEEGGQDNSELILNEINKAANASRLAAESNLARNGIAQEESAIARILDGDQEAINKYLPIVNRSFEDNYEPQNIGFFETAGYKWNFTKAYVRIDLVKPRKATDYNYKLFQILFFQKDLSAGQIEALDNLANPFQQSNFDNNPPLLKYEFHFQNKNIICQPGDLISGSISLHPKLIDHIRQLEAIESPDKYDLPLNIIENENIFESDCAPTFAGSPIKSVLESSLSSGTHNISWSFSFDSIIHQRRIVDSLSYEGSDYTLSLWNAKTENMEIGIFNDQLTDTEIRNIYKNGTINGVVNKLEAIITFRLRYTNKPIIVEYVNEGYRIRFFRRKNNSGLNFPSTDSSYYINLEPGFTPESLSGKLQQGSRISARFQGEEDIFTSKGLVKFSWEIPIDSRLLVIGN